VRNVLLTFARIGQEVRSRGSGFHLRENLVLTADHCADGQDYQVWHDGNRLTGRVVWRSCDANVDLALLEVDGLPEVEPVSLAILDTAAGGVLVGCTCGCYPSFGRLDPHTPGEPSGPDGLVPMTGNLLLDSAHVARIPDGWVRDGRVALSLTSDRSLLPDVRGTAHEVTEAWSAASGGAVMATIGGRVYCVGVISARQVKETPTVLRVAGFDLLDRLDPKSAAGFLDRIGVTGIAGLTTVGGTTRPEQVVVGQIPRRAPGYVDRAVTTGLVERIASNSAMTLVSLAGLRGAGKTQAAGGIARHCVQQGWPVVAWVNAETRDGAVSDLRLLAERLGAVVQGEPPEDSLRRLYSQWASDHATPRLVVFDNVVDRHDLDDLLPPEASAAVIATTADRSVAVGEVLDIGVFTHMQALAYLEDGTALGDATGASRVALELDGLPLALAGAVWTITRRHRLDRGYGYSRYMEELTRQPLDRLLGSDKATPGYPRATVAALSLAVDATLNAAGNRDLARSVLGSLTFLDSSGVTRQWFDALGEAFDVADTLVVIADSGLAQPSDDTKSVIMHRLVGRVVRDMADRDDWSMAAVAAATRVVNAVRPLDRETYWDRRTEADRLAVHILALLDGLDRGVDDQIVTAGVRASRILHKLSDPYTAIAVLRPLAASAERVLGADHRDTLIARNSLALAYRLAGDLGRAIPLFEETLAARERVLGQDHPDTLTSRHHLAFAYRSVGDLARAIPLFEATLAARERVLGAEDPDTLISRNNLAQACETMGDLSRAVPLFEETLAARERVLGADDPDVLNSRHNLACGYRSMGDLGRAIPLFEETLAARKRVLGADHPETLTSGNSLALAYRLAGDLGRAIPLFEATLAARERVLGADHPGTLISQNNLAAGYQSAGDLARAIPLFEETLAARERILGAGHPHTLTSRNNLAGGYQSAGDLARAIPLFEETLAARERILGAGHPDTLISRNDLAIALAEDGAGEKARYLAFLNSDQSQRLFGAKDSRTLERRDAVAQVLLLLGRNQEATALLTDLLADCRQILGDHAMTRTVERRLAHATGEATA
jgi:tetratricopeptide (TPR) repeat protein